MEENEKNRIRELSISNPKLRRLYNEHKLIESQLERFSSRPFLTSCEEMEQQTLKKKKLFGVDKMYEILRQYLEEDLEEDGGTRNGSRDYENVGQEVANS